MGWKGFEETWAKKLPGTIHLVDKQHRMIAPDVNLLKKCWIRKRSGDWNSAQNCWMYNVYYCNSFIFRISFVWGRWVVNVVLWSYFYGFFVGEGGWLIFLHGFCVISSVFCPGPLLWFWNCKRGWSGVASSESIGAIVEFTVTIVAAVAGFVEFHGVARWVIG